MPAPDSIDTADGAAGGSAPGRPDVRFVLVQPTHSGNIGAAARAIRTMGFEGLAVVAPRDDAYRTSSEAVALAANALQVLQRSQSHGTVVGALEGVTLAFAMTGYPREIGPPHLAVREAALRAASWLRQGRGSVAFVFGTERTGLTNEEVRLCHFSCAIPADARLGSLNLAQAVQVAAYEMRCALASPQPLPAAAPAPEAGASVEQIERLFVRLEQALTQVGFLDPQRPGHLMARLRSLLARAGLSAAEVELLFGICAAIIEPKHLRAGRRRGLPCAAGEKGEQ